MEDPFESLKDFVCEDTTDHTDTQIPTGGWSWTEDQHERHRERMKGNQYSKGKVPSQETRDKISAANKGKMRTPEQVAAQIKRQTGKNFIPDHLVSKNTLNNRRWRAKRRLAQETTD